jgi:hypothetical protein
MQAASIASEVCPLLLTPALNKKKKKRKAKDPPKTKQSKKRPAPVTALAPHYNLNMHIKGNLRQLRGSISLVRDAFVDPRSTFNLHDPCPGTAAPLLSIEEFCTTFLLRRHETKHKKTYATAMNRIIEEETKASSQQKELEKEEEPSDELDWLDDF